MEIEWIILADYAEIVGGKLYVQGGGWDRLTVNSGFPVQRRMGLAASFLVPWNETNQPHDVEIEIVTDDGQTLAKIEGNVEVGRPAGQPPGQPQRAQIAGNITLELKEAGTYAIIGRVDGEELRRIHFNVIPGPAMAIRS
jgi:hypothetical protein